jgi:poly(A)-specific ribonuclease
MEVTEENFELLLPQIEESLRSCEMCAIDAEFTGLSLTNPRREEVLDDAEQRYARVRTSAQNFLIMQFGLATFHWSTLTGCYEAQTYNFYVFPRPSGGMDYRFTCQV